MTAIILLALALIISTSYSWHLHKQNQRLQLGTTRLLTQAASEIEYLEARREELQETFSQVNYHGCADWLEHMSKNRPDGKYAVLQGQAEGLFEAAQLLRKEARRLGMRRK